MMTLREFVEKVNFYEHYRVYQPNRDCLIYESYFTIHSPYYWDEEHKDEWFNHDYWDNNHYNPNCRRTHELDKETKIFLEKFGDYIVSSLECSGFYPSNYTKDENGELQIEHVVDESQPHLEVLNCFNVFIIPPDCD